MMCVSAVYGGCLLSFFISVVFCIYVIIFPKACNTPLYINKMAEFAIDASEIPSRGGSMLYGEMDCFVILNNWK